MFIENSACYARGDNDKITSFVLVIARWWIGTTPFPKSSWWRHDMETYPRYWPFVWGIHRWPVDSSHKGPVTQSCDISFDVRPNIRLDKHWSCRWFETPWRSLWRHVCHVTHWNARSPNGELMTYICVSELGQHWFRKWPVVCTCVRRQVIPWTYCQLDHWEK